MELLTAAEAEDGGVLLRTAGLHSLLPPAFLPGSFTWRTLNHTLT